MKDLACPTWGLGRSNGNVVTTIELPWLPLTGPPTEAFYLDPTWASLCTRINNDVYILTTFAIFDPPSAFTPASVLVPAPLVAVVAPTVTPAPNRADSTIVPDKQGAPLTEVTKPVPLSFDAGGFSGEDRRPSRS